MSERGHDTPSLFTPSGCLTAKAIESFAHGHLSEKDRSLVSAHIESCELCSDSLDGIKIWQAAEGENFNNRIAGSLEEKALALSEKALSQTQKLTFTNSPERISLFPAKKVVLSVAASILLLIGLYSILRISNYFLKETVKNEIRPGPETSALAESKDVSKKESADISIENIEQLLNSPKPKMPAFPENRTSKQTIKVLANSADADLQMDEANVKRESSSIDSDELKATAVKGVANELSAIEEERIEYQKHTKQIVANDDSIVFAVVENMPQFPGGERMMQTFMAEHLKYPQEASENGIEGTVYVSFVVGTTGEIYNIRILKGLGGGLNEEAINMVKQMPKWIPGTLNGRAVPVLFNLPIRFSLGTEK